MGTSMTTSTDALTYFNDLEAAAVEAITERLIPDDGTGTGARAAGVVYYIDRAISGFSTDLQPVYRRGLRALDTYCQDVYGSPFIELPGADQDDVLATAIGPMSPGTHVPSQAAPLPDTAVRMVTVVREHTIEGFFCDPVYGGNRNGVGWKLVGFPGAYWGYTAQQMGPGFDGRSLPIKTLSDLRKELRSLPSSEIYTRNEVD